MLVQEFKTHFFLELSNGYPTTEIQSFFNILIQFKLNLSRVELALQPSLELNTSELDFFQQALTDLKKQIPIQYITGETEFYGLHFNVNSNVLIPRPETEELIDWIIKDYKKTENIKILDIGTGSGCIAISLAKNLPNAKIYALDISSEALKTAELNAEMNQVEIQFIEADILTLNDVSNKFDIIVSNPPYVREMEKDKMHNNVLKNEPYRALFVPDEDPLLFYRPIAKLAKNSLTTKGLLYLEINQFLGEAVKELLEESGFSEIELRKDIFGNHRMIRAK
ncbi:MAG: peptide chain release factor N(5)-glutamine methyltransferase, partial [Lutibacter sp.]|uniref:peptide chain release factor N(5)-glutamine methyltransferase n=1 Tax=Lutibacter sp. TaxID=1925666 RepID=UPI00185DEB75